MTEPMPDWLCQCGETHEDQFDACWSCGTARPGTEHLVVAEPTPAEGHQLPCSTTDAIPGHEIVSLCGIVGGEAILLVSSLTAWVATLGEWASGRSSTYEGRFRRGRAMAIDDLSWEAQALGADAVVGVTVDYDMVRDTLLMVRASGTAVTTRPIDAASEARDRAE
ncbi:MAG: heavy metal-binding domain-containing protein [Acidobacteriota bacterium]